MNKFMNVFQAGNELFIFAACVTLMPLANVENDLEGEDIDLQELFDLVNGITGRRLRISENETEEQKKARNRRILSYHKYS